MKQLRRGEPARSRLATLPLDLLIPQEELDRGNVFDTELFAGRSRRATEWAAATPETPALKSCYFGASTGAGAALLAAAGDERTPSSLPCRGGGVPVALEVAKQLCAPMDALFVRKIGAPDHEELGIGALVDGASPLIVIDPVAAQAVGASTEYPAASRAGTG